MAIFAGNQQRRRRQNVHLRDTNGVWHLPLSQLAGGQIQFLLVSSRSREMLSYYKEQILIELGILIAIGVLKTGV